jgi:hypothetical protein
MVASLWGNVGVGTKEGESNTGRVWAAGFHHVTARSCLARFETNEPFIYLIFQIFFPGRDKLRITETADTESADMVVRLYLPQDSVW